MRLSALGSSNFQGDLHDYVCALSLTVSLKEEKQTKTHYFLTHSTWIRNMKVGLLVSFKD